MPERRISAPARRVPPRCRRDCRVAGLGPPRGHAVPSAERHPITPQRLLPLLPERRDGSEIPVRDKVHFPGSSLLLSQPSLFTTWVFVHLQVSRGFSSVDCRVLGCGAPVSCGRNNRASALRLALCEFAPPLTPASGKRCRVWTSPE